MTYRSPKEPDPLPDLPDALGDRSVPGWWVFSLREPTMVWWRCPTCKGQIPLAPGMDIDPNGFVSDVVHTLGNKEGEPFCDWNLPLSLIGYRAP